MIDEATISGLQTVDAQMSDIMSDTKDNYTYEARGVIVKPSLNIGLTNLVSRDELTNWPHLKHVPILDVETSDVHILIGQDCADLLKPLEIKAGKQDEPYAVKTVFGWSINGIVNSQQLSKGKPHPASYFVRNDQQLQAQVERFWHLEEGQKTEVAMSPEDKQVISVWNKSAAKIDGHYTFDIPFKTKPPNLPDN